MNAPVHISKQNYFVPVLIQQMNSNVSFLYLKKLNSVFSAKSCLQIIAFFNTSTHRNNTEKDNVLLRIAITMKTLALQLRPDRYNTCIPVPALFLNLSPKLIF